MTLWVTISVAAQQQDSTFYLNDVVVTGTRTPKLLKETPIQTRLITADDIEKADANNIEDLLKQELPSVEFSYAMNQQTHLNMSGFGGQSILFLVDGERLAGETIDDVDFTRLDMANVERIEIVKGAASALYGSNAGGGVINIITKESTEPWRLNVNLHAANKPATTRQNWVWTLSRKRWKNALTFGYNSVESYNLKNGPNPATQVVNQVYGDSVWHFKDRFTWTPTNRLKLISRIGFFRRTVYRSADVPDEYRNYTFGLRALWEMSERDNLDFSYSFDQYDKAYNYVKKDLLIRHYSNSQNIIRGVFNHSFGTDDILTVGADWMHDYLLNKNLSTGDKQQNSVDAFMQYDWMISSEWEVVGALRYDYFSDADNSRFTPKLSARYCPIDHLNLRFGYGMGFRAPSLKERYYDFDMANIWIVRGNPSLKAETSHNFTASADYTKGHYNFTLSAYYNKVHNKIATGVPHHAEGQGAGSQGQAPTQLNLDYTNLDRYSVYGGEATAQARWDGGWSAKVSYAYTNERTPKDKDGNTANNQYIPARHHSLTARVDWDKQWTPRYGLHFSLNGRFLSSVKNAEYVDYYDISKGTHTIHYPAYTLWKLSAVQRFGTAFKWTLALDNLLNYRPKYYYFNSPMVNGINFMTTLSLDVEKLFKKRK